MFWMLESCWCFGCWRAVGVFDDGELLVFLMMESCWCFGCWRAVGVLDVGELLVFWMLESRCRPGPGAEAGPLLHRDSRVAGADREGGEDRGLARALTAVTAVTAMS